MTYYVGNMLVGEHLAHYGTKGMKWGRRRYQNPDGSLTAAGRLRYGTVDHYRARQRMIRSAANLGAVTERNARKGAAGRSAIVKAGARYDRDLAAYNKARKASKPARKAARSEWYNKNKKKIGRAAAIAGGVALGAGAAYLGYKHRGQIKDAARRINALSTQRANAIKGYKQFGFENRGLTKFDKARIDLMRNAGSKTSHLKYATGNKARAVGYKTNAFKAKAKVNAGEAINKAKKASRQKVSSISKRFQKSSVTGSKSPSIRFFANYPESMERAMASDRARRLRNSYIKRGAVAGAIGGAIGAPAGLYYGARRRVNKKKSRK